MCRAEFDTAWTNDLLWRSGTRVMVHAWLTDPRVTRVMETGWSLLVDTIVPRVRHMGGPGPAVRMLDVKKAAPSLFFYLCKSS